MSTTAGCAQRADGFEFARELRFVVVADAADLQRHVAVQCRAVRQVDRGAHAIRPACRAACSGESGRAAGAVAAAARARLRHRAAAGWCLAPAHCVPPSDWQPSMSASSRRARQIIRGAAAQRADRGQFIAIIGHHHQRRCGRRCRARGRSRRMRRRWPRARNPARRSARRRRCRPRRPAVARMRRSLPLRCGRPVATVSMRCCSQRPTCSSSATTRMRRTDDMAEIGGPTAGPCAVKRMRNAARCSTGWPSFTTGSKR